jgi:hypothetical protein
MRNVLRQTRQVDQVSQKNPKKNQQGKQDCYLIKKEHGDDKKAALAGSLQVYEYGKLVQSISLLMLYSKMPSAPALLSSGISFRTIFSVTITSSATHCSSAR